MSWRVNEISDGFKRIIKTEDRVHALHFGAVANVLADRN
jgi:hypothetical protein